jgi:hypothetical protein
MRNANTIKTDDDTEKGYHSDDSEDSGLGGSENESSKSPSPLVANKSDIEYVHLYGIFYITQSAKDRIGAALGGVILPSLFTKTFGRGMMMTKFIPEVAGQHITSQLAAQFILNNLIYAAPAIGAIAFFVRCAYVLYQERKAGKSWAEAFKKAGTEGLKTGTKFFLVYMAWSAALLAAAAMGILSGGMLPLGILFVGLMVAIGFSIASFITDKLPGIIANWKDIRVLDKMKEALVSCMLPGFFEGSVWTLMDNPIVNIAGHVAHFGGQVLDVLGVSAAVAVAFFIGVVIVSTIKRWCSVAKENKAKQLEKKTLASDQGIVIAEPLILTAKQKAHMQAYLQLIALSTKANTSKGFSPILVSGLSFIKTPVNSDALRIQKKSTINTADIGFAKKRASKALRSLGLFVSENNETYQKSNDKDAIAYDMPALTA